VLEIFREVNPKKAQENIEGASEKIMKKGMTVWMALYRKSSMKSKD
jgi:hypothetical protein